MSRLIDIDELKGCAIIRPTTHEEIEHIRACKNLISHDDIPTAMERSTAYYNDGWIPCSERLPKIKENVQITFIGAVYKKPLYDGSTAYMSPEGTWFWSVSGDKVNVEVIAWRKNLSSPYQPKGEK